jgi:hypothetical protein
MKYANAVIRDYTEYRGALQYGDSQIRYSWRDIMIGYYTEKHQKRSTSSS